MSLDTVLQAAVVRPVYIGFLDFDGDPLRAWTGPGIFAPTGTGDADLDGFTFGSAAGIVQVSDFTENMGLSDEFRITMSAADDDLDPYAQLIANRAAFQGRKAVFWRAFLADDESGVQSYVDRMFAGVMVAAESMRGGGQPGQITITCDHDLQKARSAPTRWIDHQFYNPTDTASSFINDLARGPVSASVVAATTGQQPGGDPYIPPWPIPYP